MAYIHYDEKPNGAVYACIYESYREKGKVKTRRGENLGRVIDKENNIFRQKGTTYQYIIGEGRKDVPDIALPKEPVVPDNEKLILDFGDAWFLQEYISRQPFYESIKSALPEESDTVFSLIFYRLLTNKGASCHAKIWYEGNYSYLAFPKANLTSQNISKVLKALGNEMYSGTSLRSTCPLSTVMTKLRAYSSTVPEFPMQLKWISLRSATITVT